jgi:hypothetical protein
MFGNTENPAQCYFDSLQVCRESRRAALARLDKTVTVHQAPSRIDVSVQTAIWQVSDPKRSGEWLVSPTDERDDRLNRALDAKSDPEASLGFDRWMANCGPSIRLRPPTLWVCFAFSETLGFIAGHSSAGVKL